MDLAKEQDELHEKVADKIYQQIKSYKAMIKQHVKKEIATHIANESELADPEEQHMKDIKILQMVAEA